MVDLLGGPKVRRGIARFALTYFAGSYVFVGACAVLYHLRVGAEGAGALLLIWVFSPITAPITFVAAPKLWPGLVEKVGFLPLALLLAASMALVWFAGVLLRRRRLRKREDERKAEAEKPADPTEPAGPTEPTEPVVDLGGPDSAGPQGTSLFRGCLASIGTVLRSGTSLRRQVVLDWLQYLEPEADYSSLSLTGAEEGLLDAISERLKAGCDSRWLDATIRLHVRVRRIFSWWLVLWTVVLPLGAVAALLVRRVPEEWSVLNIVVTVIVAAVAYIICVAVGVFALAILARPFAWLVGRLLGVPMQAVKEPQGEEPE